MCQHQLCIFRLCINKNILSEEKEGITKSSQHNCKGNVSSLSFIFHSRYYNNFMGIKLR